MGKRTSEALENQYKMILAQCEGNALFVCAVHNRITYHYDGAKLSPA